VLVSLVGSPVSWSPAGHRAVVAGQREEREERDDRRGHLVSERKAGERERGNRLGRPGAAGLRARPRVTGPRVLLSRAKEGGRSRPELPFSFFFLFQKCE
jgi:hypothetical protein